MQRIFTIGVATAMLSLAFAVPSVHAQKHDQYVLTASEVAEKPPRIQLLSHPTAGELSCRPC